VSASSIAAKGMRAACDCGESIGTSTMIVDSRAIVSRRAVSFNIVSTPCYKSLPSCVCVEPGTGIHNSTVSMGQKQVKLAVYPQWWHI